MQAYRHRHSETFSLPVSDEIADTERLGRRVHAEGNATKARGGTIRTGIFRDARNNTNRLSVDRLSIAPIPAISGIAKTELQNAGLPFFGWAVVNASDARKNGRIVIPTGNDLNPYHADIVLPLSGTAEEVDDARTQHAQQLSLAASWQGTT